MKMKNKSDAELILGAYHNGQFQVAARLVQPGAVIDLTEDEVKIFAHPKLKPLSAEPPAPILEKIEPAPAPIEPEVAETNALVDLLRDANATA